MWPYRLHMLHCCGVQAAQHWIIFKMHLVPFYSYFFYLRHFNLDPEDQTKWIPGPGPCGSGSVKFCWIGCKSKLSISHQDLFCSLCLQSGFSQVGRHESLLGKVDLICMHLLLFRLVSWWAESGDAELGVPAGGASAPRCGPAPVYSGPTKGRW